MRGTRIHRSKNSPTPSPNCNPKLGIKTKTWLVHFSNCLGWDLHLPNREWRVTFQLWISLNLLSSHLYYLWTHTIQHEYMEYISDLNVIWQLHFRDSPLHTRPSSSGMEESKVGQRPGSTCTDRPKQIPAWPRSSSSVKGQGKAVVIHRCQLGEIVPREIAKEIS